MIPYNNIINKKGRETKKQKLVQNNIEIYSIIVTKQILLKHNVEQFDSVGFVRVHAVMRVTAVLSF